MIVPSQQTTAAATLTLRRCGCGGNPSQFVRYDPSLPLDNDPAKRFLSKNDRWRSSVRSVYCYMMPDFTIALAIGFVIGFVLGYGLRAIISYRRRRRARRRSHLSWDL